MMTVMMAGYLKGGAAAFPVAATVVSTATAAKLITKRCGTPAIVGSLAIIGIGVVSLFGFLFIGVFFGRLSTGYALAMLFIPLSGWATEVPHSASEPGISPGKMTAPVRGFFSG